MELPGSREVSDTPWERRILPMPMVRKAKGGDDSNVVSSAPLSCPLSGSYLSRRKMIRGRIQIFERKRKTSTLGSFIFAAEKSNPIYR